MQSMTVRLVLGGTAMAASAAYHIANLRKEVEIQTKEMESMRREYDAKFDNIKEMERIRREYESKLETNKSSWWSSWFR